MIHEPESVTSLPEPSLTDGKRASVVLRQETTREWASPGAASVGSLGNVPLANIGLAVGAFLGLMVVLFVVGGVLFEVRYSGRMYPGVKALGVPLGGMTRDEARVALADRVAAMSSRSI